MKARLVLLAAALLVAAPVTLASGAARETRPVQMFVDGSTVAGAWSTLDRNASGISMTLHTSGLPAGDAATVWWVVFNEPQNCTHGGAGLRCGPGDLPPFGGDGSAETSVLYAAGHVIGGNGTANYGGHLAIGDTSGAAFGNGLTNPLGADVHLVVRDHGPVIRNLASEMIHTFGGGCSNMPPFTGPNVCDDVQFSAHEAG